MEKMNSRDLGKEATDLCNKALRDAKSHLHPLLQNIALDRLDQRSEFLKAFKSALEERIARELVVWLPGVEAVFKYDEVWTESVEDWDGSVHLLLKVPRLSGVVKTLAKRLDGSLLKHLRQSGWSRFQKSQTILEVHQVTPRELRHALGYGAMFCAVYSAPIRIWPPEG
jgi:hypothetical protein